MLMELNQFYTKAFIILISSQLQRAQYYIIIIIKHSVHRVVDLLFRNVIN